MNFIKQHVCEVIECKCTGDACDAVDEVVGTDIDGGEAEEGGEWHEEPEEEAAARLPCEYHAHGGHATMAAWEGSGWEFTKLLGVVDQLGEDATHFGMHHVVVGLEVVAEVWIYA